MKPFTPEEMNEAIMIVENAKHHHPVGWAYLELLALKPSESYVRYAFVNADLQREALRGEDERVIYATGWMQGLSVGATLRR